MTRGYAKSLKDALYWPLLLPSALLLCLGMFFLSGISVRFGHRVIDDWQARQFTGIAIGLAAAAAVVLVPYKRLVSKAYWFYTANLFLLVLVLMVGSERRNSMRWLSVFGFDVHPSELMKLTLALTLARFIRFRSSYKTFKGLGTPFLLTLLPMALVLKQPDLGTALLCIPILFTMLFVAGARLRHLLIIALLGASIIYPIYLFALRDYQRARIDVFLSQVNLRSLTEEQRRTHDQNQGYQLDLSTTAIGSGGLAGAGSDLHARNALDMVPERHNDFIFAVVGNRAGILGCLVVLVAYVALLVSILAVAARHRDPAGRLLCVGIFAFFGFQAFINIAMTVGLMPITGLTLPFLSYGRSSAVTTLVAIGLVCNVAARPSYEFGRGDFD